MNNEGEVITFRPGVDRSGDSRSDKLLHCYKTMTLLDKTVMGDRIVYIFGPKKQLDAMTQDLEG